MKRLLSLVFLLCLLTASLGSFAQDPGNGTPAFNAFSHAGGGIDTINLGNLNVHVEIPLRSLGAYGPTASASLVLDSLITTTGGLPFSTPLFFQSESTNTTVIATHRTGSTCTDYSSSAGGVTDHHATFHPTPTLILQHCNTAFTVGSPGADGWTIGGSTDSNGIAHWSTIAPNGDVIVAFASVTDAHGNAVTWELGTPSILKDALGNTAISATVGSNVTTYTYTGPNSTISTYTANYTSKTIDTAFGCPLDGSSYTRSLLTSITFPDNSTMSFTYEPVYNNSAYVTGRIKSVQLRTGATITYAYTGGTHGVNCSDGSTSGFTKTTPDGVWTFTHSAPSGTNKLSTTTVAAPSGDYSNYTFSGMYPVHEISFNSAGTQLRSTMICYNGNTTSCLSPSVIPALPITERDVYSYVPGITPPALNVFTYDPYSRFINVKNYDFGGVRGGTNYATNEAIGYGSWNGSGCSDITESVHGVSVPIMGLTCYKTVSTPAVTVSNTTFAYASGTGDLTLRRDFIGGVWRNTATNHYDSLGRLLDTTGPNNEYSTVAYGNCPGGLPSQFTSKVSGSLNLTQTIDSMDCTGELPLHTLDANNNPTTISYNGDPFWRPTSVTDAAGTTTNISHNTPTRTTTSTLVTAGSVKEFVETLDSMGRGGVMQQRLGPSSTQYNSVETDYDINGRVSRVTTPYQATLGGTNGTIVSTLYAYDGINRPTSITSPTGAVKSFTYTGGVNALGVSARDTLVALNSGPNGEHKQTQYEYNGLGRAIGVCEVTSMAGNYACGQATAQNGFSTTYSYSGPGKLLSITQNAGGSPSQVRSFTYENSNTGRMLTATTPEAGTSHLYYDSDGTCGTFIGAVVKTADNGGGSTCLQYDLLRRLTLKTYNGLNSAVTPSKTFVYDSTSNPSITCSSNQLGRLAEVSMGSAGVHGGSDEGFCYDVVGNPTDYFQSDGPSVWTHTVESYFPTGIPQTLAVATQPTITYGLNAMARIYSASASGTGQDPLTSVSYNTAGLPLTVTFGSTDTSAYTWKQGVGPMATANFKVGSSTITDTLTWNANGTLQKLIITDPLNSVDDETCTYSYDDLQRILTDNCGSGTWNQTFSYDPFGNVKKTGNPGTTWSPAYDQNTNRYQSIGATYDLNGRLTNDTFDSPIGWDIDGNIVTQTGVDFAYDGLGRTAGSVVGGVWTNYFFAPDGGLMGTVTNGGTIQKMFVPLPMSTAVYSGGVLQQYRRNDWQGSVRVASTPSNTAYSITAYGAFGEGYGASGSTNKQFAGLTSDISSGTEQVSLSRRYHPGQGRWISPDGSIPDVLNPQTFNAYHYALNRPTSVTDPTGLKDINPSWYLGYGAFSSTMSSMNAFAAGFDNWINSTFGSVPANNTTSATTGTSTGSSNGVDRIINGISAFAATFGQNAAAAIFQVEEAPGEEAPPPESENLDAINPLEPINPELVRGPWAYNLMNPGPLQPDIAQTFGGGQYSPMTVGGEGWGFDAVYRVFGGSAGLIGQNGTFYSPVPQVGGLQSQIDLGLRPEWGNTATNVACVYLAPGTTVYVGPIAAQSGYSTMVPGSGQSLGISGGIQIYVPPHP